MRPSVAGELVVLGSAELLAALLLRDRKRLTLT